MNNSPQPTDAPSPTRLRCLKDLALQTGSSFTPPATERDAKREIARMLKLKKSSIADRRREVRQVRDDMARGSGGASRVRDDELAGHGSTARWSQPDLPSEEQLDLLERLCRTEGAEFVMPRSATEAGRMIDELLEGRG